MGTTFTQIYNQGGWKHDNKIHRFYLGVVGGLSRQGFHEKLKAPAWRRENVKSSKYVPGDGENAKSLKSLDTGETAKSLKFLETGKREKIRSPRRKNG